MGPAAAPGQVLSLRRADDLARLRDAVRGAIDRAGGGTADLARLTAAASELARNTLLHGGGGHVEVATAAHGAGRKDIILTFVDSGPGIADAERALQDGFSTAGGLGLGLGGARRLCTQFDLESRPGLGTRVRILYRIDAPSSPAGRR